MINVEKVKKVAKTKECGDRRLSNIMKDWKSHFLLFNGIILATFLIFSHNVKASEEFDGEIAFAGLINPGGVSGTVHTADIHESTTSTITLSNEVTVLPNSIAGGQFTDIERINFSNPNQDPLKPPDVWVTTALPPGDGPNDSKLFYAPSGMPVNFFVGSIPGLMGTVSNTLVRLFGVAILGSKPVVTDFYQVDDRFGAVKQIDPSTGKWDETYYRSPVAENKIVRAIEEEGGMLWLTENVKFVASSDIIKLIPGTFDGDPTTVALDTVKKTLYTDPDSTIHFLTKQPNTHTVIDPTTSLPIQAYLLAWGTSDENFFSSALFNAATDTLVAGSLTTEFLLAGEGNRLKGLQSQGDNLLATSVFFLDPTPVVLGIRTLTSISASGASFSLTDSKTLAFQQHINTSNVEIAKSIIPELPTGFVFYFGAFLTGLVLWLRKSNEF